MLRPRCLHLVALLALLVGLGCGPRGVSNSDSDPAPASDLVAAQRVARQDPVAGEQALAALLARHPDSWLTARAHQDVLRQSLPAAVFEGRYAAARDAAPESGLAWYLLGRARIERFAEAMEAFSRAAELAPENPWPVAGIAYLHWAVGDMFLCVASYEAGIERMPRSAQLRLLLGNQLLNLKLIIDAQRHLELGHRLAPGNPNMTAALGKVYIELGRYESGRALLEQALEADPSLADVAMSLAGVYLRDREPEAAERMYRRALEGGLSPDDELFGAIRAAKIVVRTRGD